MTSSKKLIFFTSEYPYGKLEAFIESLVPYLSKHFDKVTIIPYNVTNTNIKRSIPENFQSILYKPKKINTIIEGLYIFLKTCLTPSVIRLFLFDVFDRKIFNNTRCFKRAFFTVIKSKLRFDSEVIQNILNDDLSNTVFFFYWGVEWSDIVPFLKKYKSLPKAVQFLGYDLYEERKDAYNGYIPYRRPLLSSLTDAIFISENMKNYQLNKFNDINFNAQLFRMGVMEVGLSQQSNDGIFRIFTCAAFVPVKRIHLLIEALKYLNFPVEWTHAGSGRLEQSTKTMAQSLPQNIKTNYLGLIPNVEVREYMTSNPIDIFVNTSESEGTPISVMEALSSGIPIFATAVGGVPEFIDDSVGALLDKDFKPSELAQKIRNFYEMPSEQKQVIRTNSRKRWEEMCNADKNYNDLAQYLASLCNQ